MIVPLLAAGALHIYYAAEAESFCLVEVEGVWAGFNGDAPAMMKADIVENDYDYRAFDFYYVSTNASVDEAHMVGADGFLAMNVGQEVVAVHNRRGEVIAFLLGDQHIRVEYTC